MESGAEDMYDSRRVTEEEIKQLAIAIREATTKHKESQSIAKRRIVRVRRRDFSLRYQEGFRSGDFVSERIEEDGWEPSDQERFQASVLKSLPEYDFLVSTLGPKAGMLESFVRAMSFASFRGLDEEGLAERSTFFWRELEGHPLPVKVTAFIDGLSISESPLVISDRLMLRRPTPEDVTEDVLLDEYGGFSFPLGVAYFSVVGEFTVDVGNRGVAQQEFLRTIEALRLFRVGGIRSDRYIMRSPHSFLGGSAISGQPSRHSRFKYTLSASDAVLLQAFLSDVAPLLPDPFQLDKGTSEWEIAYARYREALFQDGPSERAITSAITALEALFLRNEPELTHRLAQRVSVFLRVLGPQLDAPVTYKNVSRGYTIRSKFIHGGSLTEKDRPQADSLAPDLLEYARVCVLAFVQMTTMKDQLIRQLDLAMINPASVNDLETSLKPVVHR